MSRAPAETCPHRPSCPGCPRFALPGVDPAARALLDELATRAELPRPRIVQGPRFGFRSRARLAVRGRVENPKIGIFELSSHRVVHIPNCRVHHPVINEIAAVVRRAMVDHRVQPYSDKAHQGHVRYLQIAVDPQSETAQVVVITRDSSPQELEPFLHSLAGRLEPRLHSLWWNGQPAQNNAILGPLWQHVSGPQTLAIQSRGVRLHYPPAAFGQSNLPVAELIGERVSELVPNESRLVELYAGVGALGMPLAARLARWDANELNAAAVEGLRLGLEELPESIRHHCFVHPGAAESVASLVAHADVVLVDPPRKGLDPALVQALLATPPERLVYVSCGLPALLREARELIDSGKFALRALEAFALFPYTDHVETLASFDKVRS